MGEEIRSQWTLFSILRSFSVDSRTWLSLVYQYGFTQGKPLQRQTGKASDRRPFAHQTDRAARSGEMHFPQFAVCFLRLSLRFGAALSCIRRQISELLLRIEAYQERIYGQAAPRIRKIRQRFTCPLSLSSAALYLCFSILCFLLLVLQFSHDPHIYAITTVPVTVQTLVVMARAL